MWGCDHGDIDDKHSNTISNNTPLAPFQIPADGRLTEQQIADYIVIRQKIITDVKAQKIAIKQINDKDQHNPPSGFNFRHFDEIEKAAAKSFSMSYEEFLWIKDQVITIQTKLQVRRYYELNNRILTLLDQTLTRYKQINSEKPGRQEQQTMDEYVAEMRQEITGLRGKITDKEEGAALQHNISLITQYQKELENLQQQAMQSLPR